MKLLWDNFEPEAWSFWHLQYDKLEGECEKVYITNNLLTGFVDRAQHCMKYVMGQHGVFGDEPDLHVSGVWMW